MSVCKFAVGQTVRFSPDRYPGGASPGTLKVVRLQPEAASVLQLPRKEPVGRSRTRRTRGPADKIMRSAIGADHLA
jgi:hypothetical protein